MSDGSPVNDGKPDELAGQIQRSLTFVAVAALACALLRVRFPESVDEKTALFLAIAAIAVIFQRVTKFKLTKDGVEIEQLVKQAVAEQVPRAVAQASERVEERVEKKLQGQVRETIKGVDAAVNRIEKQIGPGSKSAIAPLAASPQRVAASAVESASDEPAPIEWDNDPNKGRFGGRPESNGRILTAKLTPAAGPNSAACNVHIEVRPTARAAPIAGTVRLYLHPTFGQWADYEMEIIDGVASDEITSYGAFTIGAKVIEGNTTTLLELDLMTVRGGTDAFYAE